MIYSSNSGTASIASFHSNDNLRIKGRKYFAFKNGAYHSVLKYDPSRIAVRTTVPKQVESRPIQTQLYIGEVARMYLAGTIAFLSASGLISLIG